MEVNGGCCAGSACQHRFIVRATRYLSAWNRNSVRSPGVDVLARLVSLQVVVLEWDLAHQLLEADHHEAAVHIRLLSVRVAALGFENTCNRCSCRCRTGCVAISRMPLRRL
jgi:hypothetical protein